LGLTKDELAILSLLLENKLPNTRTSVIALSGNTLTIQVKTERHTKNIQEIREILNSLEKKGIVKVDDFVEISKTRPVDLKVEESFIKPESLNIMYILGKIKDEEYERRFYETLKHHPTDNLRELIPLTLIQRYIMMLKQILSTASHIDFRRYDEILSHNDELRKLNSIIENHLVALFQNTLNILRRYIKYINEVADKNVEERILTIFIYLYPLLQPFVKRLEKRKNTSDMELEKLKAEIQVEKEIINVLEMLKEDEQKIERHRERLRILENKLDELESRSKIESFAVTLPVTNHDESIKFIRGGLVTLFGETPPTLQPIVGEFVNQLAIVLHEKFFRILAQSGRDKIDIDLHSMLGELRKEDHVIEEGQYIVKASLVWMNEYCPAMQDSIINSEGRELTICKNPECFVVYHKKCLDLLLKAGIDTCLVCGAPII